VNLFWALDRMAALWRAGAGAARLLEEARVMEREDIAVNEAIAAHAMTILPQEVTFFHHCNTGALATVGVGTALGIIRRAHESGRKVFAYLDETRPRLQGAKLSSFELMEYGVPHAIVVDGASAHIMRRYKVDFAVVGCDRVAANGDTANKIGTYNLALAAQDNGVPFYVACPTSTIDLSTATGEEIDIEERESGEVLQIGETLIAPEGAPAFNPAFDVTPNRLIAGLITEFGIIRPPFDANLKALLVGRAAR
jgi:methylthioribose-1-phosphate isomerase